MGCHNPENVRLNAFQQFVWAKLVQFRIQCMLFSPLSFQDLEVRELYILLVILNLSSHLPESLHVTHVFLLGHSLFSLPQRSKCGTHPSLHLFTYQITYLLIQQIFLECLTYENSCSRILETRPFAKKNPLFHWSSHSSGEKQAMKWNISDTHKASDTDDDYVLVFQGCHNILPTRWLNTTEFYSLIMLEARVQNQGSFRRLEVGDGMESFLLLAVSAGTRHFSPGYSTKVPVSASLFSWPPPCIWVSILLLPFFSKTN